MKPVAYCLLIRPTHINYAIGRKHKRVVKVKRSDIPRLMQPDHGR